MTIEEEAEEYLHQEFLKAKDVINEDNKYVPTEEDWLRMPKEVKKQMVDLILGFSSGENPIIKNIKLRLKLRDEELGMYVKRILSK